MTLADLIGLNFRYRDALLIGLLVAWLAAYLVTPRAIAKLRGAGITGRDRHKPGRPEVPEMGGLAVFLAFNMGAFMLLALGDLANEAQVLVLASLVVCAGATITGILDDLVILRQRFKAFIPLAFAVPLALYVPNTAIHFPIFGWVEFGIIYPLILVPLGVGFASNAFNMLEGFNGLGTWLGIVSAIAISVLALLSGNVTGLAITVPLVGALAGFLIFNVYPARVFPGDTMTLFVGAALAVAVILSKVEFWGALLLVPHVLEFLIKARSRFPTSGWGGALQPDGRLVSERERPAGLAQLVMLKTGGISEQGLVGTLLAMQFILSIIIIGGYLAATRL